MMGMTVTTMATITIMNLSEWDSRTKTGNVILSKPVMIVTIL